MSPTIDIVAVKQEIKMGRLEVIFHRGNILLRETGSGEAVKIGELLVELSSKVVKCYPKPYMVTSKDGPYGHKRIAEKFGCSVEDLCRVNNISVNKPLRAGELLKIPMPKEE